MPFREAGRTHWICVTCIKKRSVLSFNKSGLGMRRSQCRECEQAARPNDRDEQGMASSTRHNIRRRYLVLQHYSGKAVPACECCGESTYEFLSLDHIEGGGAAHRKEIGVARIYAWVWRNKLPPGFRVLCHNCNQAIGAYGFCPHQHPERSLTAPPPLLTQKMQLDNDQRLLDAAAELQQQGIAITATNLVTVTGWSLTSVEKRMARLRKSRSWPYPRVKKNADMF